jgi:transcriptional regulator
MHTPKHFEEPRVDVLHELMRRHSLATLVTMGGNGLEANHIPLFLSTDAGSLGTLRGHVSRANPVWKTVDTSIEALAVFAGPDAYISPSWYATKRETGQAVPTWNYVVAHAWGPLRVIEDPAWLRAHVEELTRAHEEGRPEPWRVTDAPPDYVSRLMAGIVGVEMTLSRIEGKWKVSQNQPPQNRAGVIEGLEASGGEAAAAIAELVRERGPA